MGLVSMSTVLGKAEPLHVLLVCAQVGWKRVIVNAPDKPGSDKTIVHRLALDNRRSFRAGGRRRFALEAIDGPAHNFTSRFAARLRDRLDAAREFRVELNEIAVGLGGRYGCAVSNAFRGSFEVRRAGAGRVSRRARCEKGFSHQRRTGDARAWSLAPALDACTYDGLTPARSLQRRQSWHMADRRPGEVDDVAPGDERAAHLGKLAARARNDKKLHGAGVILVTQYGQAHSVR